MPKGKRKPPAPKKTIPISDPRVRRSIAAAVEELIESKGNSRERLWLDHGIHKSLVSDILGKGRAPRPEVLIELSRALGRSVDSILGLSGAHG